MASQSTEDATAKRKFEQMAMDIESHIRYLNSRLDYLNGSNIAYSRPE